jgi:hypothetical protein
LTESHRGSARTRVVRNNEFKKKFSESWEASLSTKKHVFEQLKQDKLMMLILFKETKKISKLTTLLNYAGERRVRENDGQRGESN